MYKMIAGLLLGAFAASVLPQVIVFGDGKQSDRSAPEMRQHRSHADGDQPWRGGDDGRRFGAGPQRGGPWGFDGPRPDGNQRWQQGRTLAARRPGTWLCSRSWMGWT